MAAATNHLMEQQENADAEVQQNGTESTEQTQEQALTAEEIADLQKKAKGFDDQKKRAEKAEGELKKLKPQETKPVQQEASGSSNDDLVRARLEARGVLDEDKQDAVLEAAKVLGISPIKALDNEIVKGRLAAMDSEKKTKDATPAPSRGGGTTTNISRLADKAFETGELPTDPKLKALVKEEMRKRK